MVKSDQGFEVRKPDSGEPWRYVTPCCCRQPQTDGHRKTYVCQGCGESYKKSELVDLKKSDRNPCQ